MTILVAEDDGLHRRYIHDVLADHFTELGNIIEVTSSEDVEEALAQLDVRFAVLDLQMKGISGIEIAKRIWRKHPESRILFWSNYADEPYVRGVTRIVPKSAAYGYLLKSADEERLIHALRGVFFDDQCIIDREIRGIQSRTQDRFEGLTDVDYEILYDISVGLTDKAISVRRQISTRGVQSRLQALYEKLITAEIERYDDTFLNTRTRVICLALMRGLLNRDIINREAAALSEWFARREQSGG